MNQNSKKIMMITSKPDDKYGISATNSTMANNKEVTGVAILCSGACKSACASACASNCGSTCASACASACASSCWSLCSGGGSADVEPISDVEDIIL